MNIYLAFVFRLLLLSLPNFDILLEQFLLMLSHTELRAYYNL